MTLTYLPAYGLYVDTETSAVYDANQQPLTYLPNPETPTFVTASASQQTVYDTTDVSQTDDTYATTIEAVLSDGQVVYQQTFALAYADATVQAAIAAADAIVAEDDESPGAPTLVSSQTTNQGSQTTTVTTGQSSVEDGQATTVTFGPAILGPEDFAIGGVLTPNAYLYVDAGQLDIDVDTHYTLTIDQTATTTTTELLTQQYDIDGVVPCFRAGTSIATMRGEIAVERLRPGDRVITALGAQRGTRPVRWLGHRAVSCRAHPRPAEVWPVRVAAHAFGPGLPFRDLFLSPDHAVFVDGVLIPIRYLVNGGTIAQLPVDTVAYWHIELDRHDVLLAEGLACESYLDAGNRAAFANGSAAVRLHPHFAAWAWEARGCAELIVTGPRLAAVKTWLDDIAPAPVALSCLRKRVG
jgi:hypothetical protein